MEWAPESCEVSSLLSTCSPPVPLATPEDCVQFYIMDSMDMSLSKLWEMMKAGTPGVLQSTGSRRAGHNWATEQQQQRPVVKRGWDRPEQNLRAGDREGYTFQITSDERLEEGSRAVFSGRMEALRDTSALKHPKARPGRRRFGSALQSSSNVGPRDDPLGAWAPWGGGSDGGGRGQQQGVPCCGWKHPNKEESCQGLGSCC